MLGVLAGGLGRWLAAGAVVAALGGLVLLQRAELRAATLERDVAGARAAAAEARTAALEADIERVNAAVARVETARRTLDAALAPTRREIADAPVTTACVDAAPVRAALDRLRTRPGTDIPIPPRRPAAPGADHLP